MEFSSGNIFVRTQGPMRVGTVVEGHVHRFDHTTYINRGAFRIDQLDGEQVVRTIQKRATDEKNWILIKAEVCHRLTALENDSIYHCIYSHRLPQGDVTQEATGWEEAYG